MPTELTPDAIERYNLVWKFSQGEEAAEFAEIKRVYSLHDDENQVHQIQLVHIQLRNVMAQIKNPKIAELIKNNPYTSLKTAFVPHFTAGWVDVINKLGDIPSQYDDKFAKFNRLFKLLGVSPNMDKNFGLEVLLQKAKKVHADELGMYVKATYPTEEYSPDVWNNYYDMLSGRISPEFFRYFDTLKTNDTFESQWREEHAPLLVGEARRLYLYGLLDSKKIEYLSTDLKILEGNMPEKGFDRALGKLSHEDFFNKTNQLVNAAEKGDERECQNILNSIINTVPFAPSTSPSIQKLIEAVPDNHHEIKDLFKSWVQVGLFKQNINLSDDKIAAFVKVLTHSPFDNIDYDYRGKSAETFRKRKRDGENFDFVFHQSDLRDILSELNPTFSRPDQRKYADLILGKNFLTFLIEFAEKQGALNWKEFLLKNFSDKPLDFSEAQQLYRVLEGFDSWLYKVKGATLDIFERVKVTDEERQDLLGKLSEIHEFRGKQKNAIEVMEKKNYAPLPQLAELAKEEVKEKTKEKPTSIYRRIARRFRRTLTPEQRTHYQPVQSATAQQNNTVQQPSSTGSQKTQEPVAKRERRDTTYAPIPVVYHKEKETLAPQQMDMPPTTPSSNYQKTSEFIKSDVSEHAQVDALSSQGLFHHTANEVVDTKVKRAPTLAIKTTLKTTTEPSPVVVEQKAETKPLLPSLPATENLYYNYSENLKAYFSAEKGFEYYRSEDQAPDDKMALTALEEQMINDFVKGSFIENGISTLSDNGQRALKLSGTDHNLVIRAYVYLKKAGYKVEEPRMSLVESAKVKTELLGDALKEKTQTLGSTLSDFGNRLGPSR